jgi:hypothetical protein
MESGNYGRKFGILKTHPLKNRTRVSNLTILLLERFVKKKLPVPEIKPRISMAKAAFNKTNSLVTRNLDLNLRTKLVCCSNWRKGLYSTGN